MDIIYAWILNFLATNPNMAVLITMMAFCRIVFKPTCALIQTYVDTTETKVDNEKWIAIQASKPFKAFLWLLDFFASVKVPKSTP